MRIIALLALVCVVPLVAPSQTTTVPEKSSSKTSKPAGSKTTSKRTRTATKGGKTTAKHGKKTRGKAAASWRSRQLAPTQDRYKEIQSALASRGYLKGSASGVWDTQSADALRRFQQDQNLEPTGKLNSLSLIALGLGAKRGGPVGAPGTSPVPGVVTPRTPGLPDPAPQNPAPPAPAPPASAPPGTQR